MGMKSIQWLVQNLLAPIQCVVCRRVWQYLCSIHAAYLLAYPDSCWICQTPTHNAQCCLEHYEYSPLQWVLIGFYYTRIVQYMVHKSKYSWAYALLSYFWSALSLVVMTNKILAQAIISKRLIVSYIPMHRRKEYYHRWYNQAYRLASYIAAELWVPCIKLAEKKRYTFSQVTKWRSARQKTPSWNYKILSWDIPDDVVILLVDDIITTWSTLSAVATCLQEKYRTNPIRWLCIARNK